MKREWLVIVDQHATVNMYSTFALTARHVLRGVLRESWCMTRWDFRSRGLFPPLVERQLKRSRNKVVLRERGAGMRSNRSFAGFPPIHRRFGFGLGWAGRAAGRV